MPSEQITKILNRKLINLVSRYQSAENLDEKVDINTAMIVLVSTMVMEDDKDAKRLTSLVERLVR